MIRAWRLPDGRYRLSTTRIVDFRRLEDPATGWRYNPVLGMRTYPEWSLEGLGAEKVYGVVTGPSSCGCQPTMFRWVTGSEVRAGKTLANECLRCTDYSGRFVDPRAHQCDIIDVCGEAEVAESVYEAEFRSGVEALS